jgi:hypothetical protein
MTIYIDGTAGMPMYQFNGDVEQPDPAVGRLKTDFIGYFPFYHLEEEERDNALIIGPGGGRDILLALMGGIGQITAVEVNKDVVDIVREYREYNGGIYTDSAKVNVVVDEGRNFLKRQKGKYDLIMLNLPVTQTSRSLEGYSLTENFLFTTESIDDYLEHLTDEGRLVVLHHDDFTIWKLLSVSLAALNERGISQERALDQIYIMGLSSAPDNPLFVLKKTPFTPSQASLRHGKMRELGYDPTLAYFPHITGPDEVNQVLWALSSGLLTLDDVKLRMANEFDIDISAVTDNSPFFYNIDVGLPQPVSLVFWMSLLTMLLVLVVPPFYRSTPKKESRFHKASHVSSLRPVVLFSLLGIGFMLVEISLIQSFVLFLGQPVLSMAILIFSLLVGAGLGSLYSGRLASEKLGRMISTAALGVAIVIVIYAFLLPFIFNQLLGLDIAIRLLAMVALLVPLGFLMGFPFPLGIRWVRERQLAGQIPWMWGINGVGSVLGSALTIVLAIVFGFTQALLAGAVCYLVVFLTFRRHRTEPS